MKVFLFANQFFFWGGGQTISFYGRSGSSQDWLTYWWTWFLRSWTSNQSNYTYWKLVCRSLRKRTQPVHNKQGQLCLVFWLTSWSRSGGCYTNECLLSGHQHGPSEHFQLTFSVSVTTPLFCIEREQFAGSFLEMKKCILISVTQWTLSLYKTFPTSQAHSNQIPVNRSGTLSNHINRELIINRRRRRRTEVSG